MAQTYDRSIKNLQNLLLAECRSAFKIVYGKPTGKNPLGRPRHRWEEGKFTLSVCGQVDMKPAVG